jgi:DNA-binding NtrC family response regulator
VECFEQPFSGLLQVERRDPGLEIDSAGPVMLGESTEARRLRSQIQRVAPYFRIALLRGETGCGKEWAARAIHALSPGADGPFVVADAVAVAESVAGETMRAGRRGAESPLESAEGGTLYLKGAGELPFGLQAALYQFLREHSHGISPTAGLTRFDRSNWRRVDVRVVAASDCDLRTLAAIGQFRQDLYAHLSAVEILVPPLRQRVEDIPLMAEWMLRRLTEATGQVPKQLALETASRLQEHLWPENFRELKRVVCQAAALAEGGVIEPRHLMPLMEPKRMPEVRIERLHDMMERHVLDVLTRCGGNKLRAAELLGISRSTLYRMLDARTARESAG